MGGEQEIKDMNAQMSKNVEEMGNAKSLRLQEAEKAVLDQQEMQETLQALGKAVGILGKLHGKSLTQSTATSLVQVMSSSKHIRDKLQKILPEQGSQKPAFLQSKWAAWNNFWNNVK